MSIENTMWEDEGAYGL